MTRFPSPQMMSQASSTAWVMWIRDETNKAMMMLDEEVAREGDPDDPFNGTAGGVFELPPGRTNSLSLPPPVHTPRVTQGAAGVPQPKGGDEHLIPSQLIRSSIQPETRNATTGNGSDKQSTPSLDPNHSIRQLHTQQRATKSTTRSNKSCQHTAKSRKEFDYFHTNSTKFSKRKYICGTRRSPRVEHRRTASKPPSNNAYATESEYGTKAPQRCQPTRTSYHNRPSRS